MVLNGRIIGLACLGVGILACLLGLSAAMDWTERTALQVLFDSVSIAIVVLIGYEVFFAVQRRHTDKTPTVVRSRLDDSIPFVAKWVWIYGALYYVVVFFPLALMPDRKSCFLFIAGGVAILACATPVYVLWPTQCPDEWRSFEQNNRSARFLAFIQTFDNGRNCIPSLHTAYAAYAAVFYPWTSARIVVPTLIALACVLVKQHSVVDIFPSVVFGVVIAVAVKALLL